jgi:hypothetical protein
MIEPRPLFWQFAITSSKWFIGAITGMRGDIGWFYNAIYGHSFFAVLDFLVSLARRFRTNVPVYFQVLIIPSRAKSFKEVTCCNLKII